MSGLVVSGCESSGDQAAIDSKIGAVSMFPAPADVASFTAPSTEAAPLAASAGSDVDYALAERLQLPICVRDYGVPNVVDIQYQTSAQAYGYAKKPFPLGNLASATRTRFYFLSRNEKITVECGSITVRTPMNASDRAYVQMLNGETGGRP